MTFKSIPAGEFLMGSPDDKDAEPAEKPQHRVRISKPFYLGVCEVTQAQYARVMGSNPSHFYEKGNGNDRVAGQSTEAYPAEDVCWLDAIWFSNRLSELEGKKPFYEIEGKNVRVRDWNGPGYRLPTEAEWEYACRAGSAVPTPYLFGSDAAELGEYGWFAGNSDARTHPVSQKRPNNFGLFDIHGNVFEWCWDSYAEDYYKQSVADDPTGPVRVAAHVIRGGGWGGQPQYCRAAARYGLGWDDRRNYVGFRLALGQAGNNVGSAHSTEAPRVPVAMPQHAAPGHGESDSIVAKSIDMKLVLIPAGEFVMGSPDADKDAANSEKPQHRVRISKPFYLGVSEVTQAQYEKVMGNNPSYFFANGTGSSRVSGQSTEAYPVEHVTWLDAVRFCNRLSEKEGKKPFYKIGGNDVQVSDWNGPGYRLPTEAEWEYACRAGSASPTPYSFGSDAAELGEYGWFAGNSDARTHPVSQKRPNRFGLYDMHGNVWEWCWDEWRDGYSNQSRTTDPTAIRLAGFRASRGGGWSDGPRDCRSASRGRNGPGDPDASLGFRVALGQSGR
jgi:formylglycine-generating enzyme required for sulfatase activity